MHACMMCVFDIYIFILSFIILQLHLWNDSIENHKSLILHSTTFGRHNKSIFINNPSHRICVHINMKYTDVLYHVGYGNLTVCALYFNVYLYVSPYQLVRYFMSLSNEHYNKSNKHFSTINENWIFTIKEIACKTTF